MLIGRLPGNTVLMQTGARKEPLQGGLTVTHWTGLFFTISEKTKSKEYHDSRSVDTSTGLDTEYSYLLLCRSLQC